MAHDNPIIDRASASEAVKEWFFPSFSSLRKEDLRGFLDDAVALRVVTARQVGYWQIKSLLRKADADDPADGTLVRDFVDRNIGPPCRFLAEDISRLNRQIRVEEASRFHDMDGLFSWQVFWEHHPQRTTLLINLSRVGFSSTRDYALLYISTLQDPLAGCGRLVLLKRLDGKWHQYGTLSFWIA